MIDTRIKEIWAGLGKIIRLANMGANDAADIKSHMVATLQQFGHQGGSAEQYDDFIKVVVPLETRVQPTIAAIERIPALAKTSAEQYVRVLGAELNQAPTASTSAILDAFKASMIANAQTIAPSGGAFYNYFAANFGYSAFPTSATPSIPDSWITSAVFSPNPDMAIDPPSAPTFTSGQIEAAGSGILINWSDTDAGGSNVVAFRINRKIGAGAYAVIFVTEDQFTLGYLDTGAPSGQVASYTIQALNGGGWSALSVERSKISQGPN